MNTTQLIQELATKLNQEMKNIVKKQLTKEIKRDIIDISREREDTKK